LTSTTQYELNEKISNIAAHGKGEEANMPRFMLNGIFA
jgi:hypothetical protein